MRRPVGPASASASAAASAAALGGQCLAEALAGPGQQGPGRDVADTQGGGQLETGQIVELRQEQRRALTLGDLLERALERGRQASLHGQVLDRRRGSVRLAGPGQEPHDLAPAELVEGHAMGDLVQPRPGVGRIRQRGVVPIGLHEGVLGHVGGHLGSRTIR